MENFDLNELSQRLAELAEVLAGKAPTKKGLQIWLETLATYPMADVLSVLTDWPRAHAKSPLPVDIVQACEELAKRRRENLARTYAEQARVPWSPADLPANSEIARCELAKIKAILTTPSPDPKAWAHKLKVREQAGEQLSIAQAELWRAALQETLTSESDEEARLERQVIQAEGSMYGQ